MSIKRILQSLQDLIKIHEDLYRFSMQKTAIIKEGSVEKFQSILAKERKYVHQLNQAEEERREAVLHWCEKHQIKQTDLTITEILDTITDAEDQQQLEQSVITLTKVITALKQQEQLNYELIQQSMQFVQLSLDMLSPTIKNMNYGHHQNAEGPKRSTFDSKA